ncbi:MAG: hypothetical protein ABR598_00600 [Candidatus Dormibacteria bacterium]
MVVVVVTAGAAVATHQRQIDHVALAIDILPAGTDLRCSLAIASYSNDLQRGFIDFRNGQATFRPAATHVGDFTYVRALNRWVDAASFIAPDGQSYAYRTNPTKGNKRVYGLELGQVDVHIVDGAGDRVIGKTDGDESGILGFSSQGIVLITWFYPPGQKPAYGTYTVMRPGTDPTPLKYLQVMDPRTGAIRKLGPSLTDGKPHAQVFPSRQPTASPRGGGGLGFVMGTDSVWNWSSDGVSKSKVERYNAAAPENFETWWDSAIDGPGDAVVIGADEDGHPILQVTDRDAFHLDRKDREGIGTRIVLLTAPHAAQVLRAGRMGAPGVPTVISSTAPDGARTWFASEEGQVWLYQRGTGFQQVAQIHTSSAGTPGVKLSGRCV